MDEKKDIDLMGVQPRNGSFKGKELTEEQLKEFDEWLETRRQRTWFLRFVDIPDDDAEITDELEFDPNEPFPEEILNYESLENPTEEETAAFDAWWKQKAQEQREARARREAEQKDD